MAALIFSLLVLGIGIVFATQHSPYSLQAAVDALHRREAQLALREGGDPEQGEDDGYWMEAGDEQKFRPNRQKLNRLLANYLRREGDSEGPPFDGYDQYEEEKRKRSMFREREETPYPTVFREREMNKPDLTADFLKEIDKQSKLEQEEKYLDRLRRLWEKYQQQENEIEQELFDEDQVPEEAYFDKRMMPQQSEAAAMFYGPIEKKKRTMPILPWLPATRKKRFPVAKRSPKYVEPEASMSGTNEKVAKDLQALFGEPIEEKKKRSSEIKKRSNDDHEHDHADGHVHEVHENNKHEQSEEHDDEEHEHDDDHEEHDHDREHEHDHEEDEEDETEDEDDDKKKKRSVKKRSNLEVVKEDQILPGDIGEFKQKKSIQWNKYFGMDRRKKGGREPYPLSFYKSYDEDRKKKNINEDKLENMDKKLKNIEDLILDQTVKYTGAHEGVSDPEDLQKLKDKVVSRLATAYSLEKMRHTLEKLKDSVEEEQHVQKNEIDNDKRDDTVDKEKRVAVKKEKAEFDNNQHSLEGNDKVSKDEVENDLEDVDEEKKMKKKRTVKRYQDIDAPDFEEELGAGHYAPLSEGYMGGKDPIDSSECPLLDALERRCRGVDVLSGDIYQDLLPACGAHQLCYLCGASSTVCDYQYLQEAATICENIPNCQGAARSALMILRGFPGSQMGPRECAKNPCLYRAMLDMGVAGL